jgi:hypothetical protein
VAPLTARRLLRERETLRIMLAMYCGSHHAAAGTLVPCPVCANLLEYAWGRLEKCPYGEGKPVCARCTTHCYKAVPREAVRAAMRYAGPRMLLYHPVLALRHLAHRLRQPPRRRSSTASS